jgi:hypothetical protein
MAHDTAVLQHPLTGIIKQAPLGFSWTMFFFGFFPPMFRGDWKWFGIVFGLGILMGLISGGFLGWLPGVVGAFIWNKSYLTSLVSQGYQLKGLMSGQDLSLVDSTVGFRIPRSA